MKFSFVTLFVKDMEKSLSFYRDFLGMKLQRRQPAKDGELAFLGNEGKPMIELVYSPGSPAENPKGFSIGFEVESLEKATLEMEKQGYKLLRGPVSPGPKVSFSFFAGPGSEEIQLIEYK